MVQLLNIYFINKIQMIKKNNNKNQMTLITVSNDKSKKEDSNNFENSYTYMYFDFNLRYNLKQI